MLYFVVGFGLKYTNPFMPNEFSHLYQLDESISNFRVVVLLSDIFHFDSNFDRTLCKQTVAFFGV